MIIAIAQLLMLSGRISPKCAKRTGATPRPYANAVQITLVGSAIIDIL